jgi:hypothetical protein
MRTTYSSELQGSHILEGSTFKVTDITPNLTYHFIPSCDLNKLSCEGTCSIYGISVEICDQVFNCHTSKYSMREFYACSRDYISFIITEKQHAKRKMARRDNECSFHSIPLTKNMHDSNEISLWKPSNVYYIQDTYLQQEQD